MDIEWAKDGETGKLYIVQARPETVQSRADASSFERFVVRGKPTVRLTGVAVGSKVGAGRVRVIARPDELSSFEEGEVLVTEMTDPDWVPAPRRAAAVVTDRGGRTCHAAIVGRELRVPFACKARGTCPSCMGRRMGETAALWVQHLLPPVAYRQFVLSFDGSMAMRLGYNAELLGRMCRHFARRVSQSLRGRVKREHRLDTVATLHPGIVTVIQRFRSDLGLYGHRSQVHMVVGMAFGVQSVLVLAPKIISLMPGIIRASIVTKLIFPGSTVPGWLMVLAAPMYALFAYSIVLLPYQITGSVYFVVGNLGIMLAQPFIGWSGRQFTVPMSHADANVRIHRAWMAYIAHLVLGGIMMVIGLYDVLTQLDYGPVRVISAVLSFMGNVLVMTFIGTDAIIANMQRLRRVEQPTAAQDALRQESADKLTQFCQ